MKIKFYLIYIGIVVPLLLGCNNKVVTDKHNFSAIDSLFNAAVENNEIPGVVALISHQDKIIYNKAFGFRNIEEDDLLKVNDIFRLASMTKALTAVAILQLQEKGLLEVNDFVYKYLPEFKNPKVLIEVLPDSSFTSKPSMSEITIHQLLTHTSGLSYANDDDYGALVIKNDVCEGFGYDKRTARENITKIADLPLLHEPGEAYTYGLSYDVLGVIIEQVSGQRFDQYIKKHILEPCGMKDSYFIVPNSERYRLPSVYEPARHVGIRPASYPDTTYPCLNYRRFFSGGADLCSTAKDYHAFLRMLKNKGEINGQRLLQAKSVEKMLRRQTNLGEGDSYQGYAAWVTNTHGAETSVFNEGSYGFGGFFDTYSWTDPKANISAVLLLQMYPGNKHQIHEKFQTHTYELLKP